jgi:hypothetical protein
MKVDAFLWVNLGYIINGLDVAKQIFATRWYLLATAVQVIVSQIYLQKGIQCLGGLAKVN